MKAKAVLFVASLSMLALAMGCSNGSGGGGDDDGSNVGKAIKGSLYIDNIRFEDASGTVLGTFDSFENLSGTDVLCGGSAVDVWQDLTTWGGQAVSPASSTLHPTDGTKSLLVPVDMTISSTDADNYQWLGVNWSTATSGGILLPSALAANWGGAAKVVFDYYWVPDSSSSVSSTTDLQLDASVEWNDSSWAISSSGYYGANSKGKSASLAAGASGSGSIALDNAVYAGSDQCYEIGFGVHYVGSLE